jgi:hypothetical protein
MGEATCRRFRVRQQYPVVFKTTHFERKHPAEALAIVLDFGHSGIDHLQMRQGRADTVLKLGEVWWRGGHHEITQPPMPRQ